MLTHFVRPLRDEPNTNSRALRMFLLRIGTGIMQGSMCTEVRKTWGPFLQELRRCVAEKKLRSLVLPSPLNGAFFGELQFVCVRVDEVRGRK